MTEEEAQGWIDRRFGDTAVALLAKFIELIDLETPRQNLISAGSREHVWTRHIVDSAQLLDLTDRDGCWLDVGTGAGFPGLVTAVLTDRETVLVEPRRRRVEFLEHAVETLGMVGRVMVRQSRVEAVQTKAAVISARAVASIDSLLDAAQHCADRNTVWLLPKGRNAVEEVAQAKKSWQGTFHVEHSITDSASMIVVASGIVRR